MNGVARCERRGAFEAAMDAGSNLPGEMARNTTTTNGSVLQPSSPRLEREAEYATLFFPVKLGLRVELCDGQIAWGITIEDLLNDVWCE